MFPNDADGNAWLPGWANVWAPAGLTPTVPSQFQDGTEDFTAQIAQFKKAGCEIGMGVFIPPDFTNFWKQAIQQGWKPKLATYAKALLFPQSVEALGASPTASPPRCGGPRTTRSRRRFWARPASSSPTSSRRPTTAQWTQPLLHFIVFEMAVDALKRATSVDDKEAIIAADQDHQARHHRRPHRLHRAGCRRDSALPGGPVPHRRERLQDPAGRWPVAHRDRRTRSSSPSSAPRPPGSRHPGAGQGAGATSRGSHTCIRDLRIVGCRAVPRGSPFLGVEEAFPSHFGRGLS